MKTRRKEFFAVFFAICCLFATPSVFAAWEISGQIVYLPPSPPPQEEFQPVPNATVIAESESSEEISTGTGPDGNFTFTGLGIGTWIIQASPPEDNEVFADYAPTIPIVVLIQKDEDKVDLERPLEMNISRILSGYVELPDGQPANEAFVTATFDDGDELREAETNEAGFFEIEDMVHGNWIVYAQPPAGDAYKTYGWSDPIEVNVREEDTNNVSLPATLMLKEEGDKKISGTVTYEGAGVPDIEITANNWKVSEKALTALTDERGYFEIWVGSGKWEVKATQKQGVEWISPLPQEVEISHEDTTDHEVVNIVLEAATSGGGILKGTILGADGSALTTTDGSENTGITVCAENPASDFSSEVHPDGTGSFSFPLSSGIYELSINVDGDIYPDYGNPKPEVVRISQGETNDLGNIRLTSRGLTVSGQVTDKDGAAISGVQVNAWIPNREWFSTETDTFGNYMFNLSSGRWMIMPFLSGQFNEEFKEADLKDSNVEDLNFTLETFGNTLTGSVQDQGGNILTIDAMAYARLESSPRPVSQIRVEEGQFTLNLSEGTSYYIGLRLAPGSPYAFSGDEEIAFSTRKRTSPAPPSKGEGTAISTEKKAATSPTNRNTARNYDVTFTLKSGSSVIKGQFLDPDSNPIIGIEGIVLVSPVTAKAPPFEMDIDTSDGSFSLTVPEGKWLLGYELETTQYQHHPYQPIQIEIAEGETKIQDITLEQMDRTIRGTVVDPDGNPMSNVQVGVQKLFEGDSEETFFASSVFTDANGEFEFLVPHRITKRSSKGTSKDSASYKECIYTAVDLCGEDDTYCLVDAAIDCEQELYRSSSKNEREVTLTLRQANTYLKGKVFKEDGTTPAEEAFVYAYSSDGQKTRGYTDSSGEYQLQAAKTETWVVKAVYKEAGETTYYRSSAGSVASIADDAINISDLTLKNEGEMPIAANDEFKVSEGWSYTLSDGIQIQIPANTVRTEEDEVMILVEPVISDIPDTLENRLLNYGYSIEIYEKTSGTEVTDAFTDEIVIIFPYTDEQLTSLGFGSGAIRPAYFQSESNSWQTMESFTLDTENKQITLQTTHLSHWALVASTSEETTDGETTIQGDIDNSGTIDLADMILGLQLCVQIPVSVNVAADTDGDTKIGLAEVVYILRKLAE